MRKAEIRALGELAGDVLAAGGKVVGDMHAGIASRPFAALGPAAHPVQAIHDGISTAIYSGLRSGLRLAGRGGGELAALRSREEGPPLASTLGGSLALGALNGLYGNHLEAHGNELALPMTLRPDRLRVELGLTPLYLSYNTGLHISDNGRRLAELLDELESDWPVAVEEITLVGHSMGGLVARSACHHAMVGELSWSRAVRHVFCLGSPHLGADLEKGANVLGWALGRLPETRAFGEVINARSAGIKDLRYGSCIEDDWCDCDPDELLRDRCSEVPFLPGAAYYFVAASLRDGPVGSLFGDLLVRLPSASGRGSGGGRRIEFEVENGCELAGLTHFDLLNHPDVYEQLRTWITRADRTPS